ncbi:SLC13 family permease [Noviherbaspirillum sp.]|uniref:SLC13 family permease n=1 Tax=Noviherbaspirillum sp. TaxID=1926288 RepID=UPI002B48EE7E|nr:SLC13 family permease [Noviherbaspirillum sp.]HJV79815.1 SLC13 family permease [Noviherbaspirillum sp.]
MADTTDTIDILLRDEVFSRSNYQSLARLLPQLAARRFATGETIYRAGDAADHFYLLADGAVKLVSPEGRESGLMHRRFGEEAASDASHYLTDAVALAPVHVLSIPRGAMTALVAANPALKTDLLLSLASHLAGERLQRHSAQAAARPAARGWAPVAGWLLTLLLPLLVLLYGGRFGLDRNALTFTAIFSATVSMWVFNLVDDYIPGLFALLATLVTGLVPAPVILSGFASDGFMMALSTLALGTVVVSSGLSYRVMLTLLLRLPNTQFWHFAGLFITGSFLTPVIPTANGRVALVAPFYADMVESLYLKPQGAAATRLAIACFGGISLFSAMVITSKSVNFAVFGLLPPQGQDHFQWLTWLLTASVAGAALLALNAVAVAIWFRNGEVPQLPKERVQAQLKLLGPMKTREWAALAGVGFMIVGIVTSSIHKVQPPWLGFAMLFGLLLCGVLRKQELKEKVDWTFLLYLSGITGIVAAFDYLGLDKALGAALPGLGATMRGSFGVFVLLLFGLVNLVRLVVPINATVVILAAILMPLADIGGVNPWVVGFIILLFAETWFFPYQCSYYLQLQEANRQQAMYDERAFLRFNALMNFARLAAVYVSLPYWKMLGLL